jgi:hypothetical protein
VRREEKEKYKRTGQRVDEPGTCRNLLKSVQQRRGSRDEGVCHEFALILHTILILYDLFNSANSASLAFSAFTSASSATFASSICSTFEISSVHRVSRLFS